MTIQDVDDPGEAVRERYQQERAKRLRSDGNAQYNDLRGDHGDFDRDPYADPDFTRAALDKEVTAIIVGGGFAGMLTAIELKAKGIDDFLILDKAGDFGGTWYWNRYPGCMCDVESYVYLPLLEETGYMPTERYASAPEIFAHCQRLGHTYGLYDQALFQTMVTATAWSADTQRWSVETSRGDQLTSRFVITAGGLLHKAKLPGIVGLGEFAGSAFHTSRWDYAVTGGSPTEAMDNLADKRVGIIGTGATAIQAVPRLAEAAAEVYVFQRTAAAVGVRGNRPTDEAWFKSLEPGWQADRIRNFTEAVTGNQPEVDMVDDGWTQAMWVNSQKLPADDDERRSLEQADLDIMDAVRRRVDEIVEDPDTADKLKPWYGKHCKRLCFHDEYLPAFNQDHVHLVDTDGRGVDRITAEAVVVDGTSYPVDVLIFASGFEVTTQLYQRLGFDPAGRDGVPMSEKWHDGAHTLHGVLSGGFPNQFIMSIVQAGYGTNFVHLLTESSKHIAWLVSTCIERGIAEIEATTEAEEDWLMVLYQSLGGTPEYNEVCTPSYYNSEGSADPTLARNLTYLGSLNDYAAVLTEWREAAELAGVRIVMEGDAG